jgi:hypothetical protein
MAITINGQHLTFREIDNHSLKITSVKDGEVVASTIVEGFYSDYYQDDPVEAIAKIKIFGDLDEEQVELIVEAANLAAKSAFTKAELDGIKRSL